MFHVKHTTLKYVSPVGASLTSPTASLWESCPPADPLPPTAQASGIDRAAALPGHPLAAGIGPDSSDSAGAPGTRTHHAVVIPAQDRRRPGGSARATGLVEHHRCRGRAVPTRSVPLRAGGRAQRTRPLPVVTRTIGPRPGKTSHAASPSVRLLRPGRSRPGPGRPNPGPRPLRTETGPVARCCPGGRPWRSGHRCARTSPGIPPPEPRSIQAARALPPSTVGMPARSNRVGSFSEALSVGDLDFEGTVSQESPRPSLGQSIDQRRGQRMGLGGGHQVRRVRRPSTWGSGRPVGRQSSELASFASEAARGDTTT